MTVSIANLTATWIDTGNTYTGIGMNVAAPFGASAGSRLLNLSINGTSEFSVDANGRAYVTSIYFNNFLVSQLPAATSVPRGTFYFVVDSSNDFSNNVTGIVVSGGGGRSVPVYSDGTNWRIG
jgi:hypothetical protein